MNDSIPTHAIFCHAQVLVLGYEGNGRFLIVDGERTTITHRRNLKFLRAPIKAVAAVDEALETMKVKS